MIEGNDLKIFKRALSELDAAGIKLEDSFTVDLGAGSIQSIELVAMLHRRRILRGS